MKRFHEDKDDIDTLYICTSMDFDRIEKELVYLASNEIEEEDGIGCTFDTEPFLLSHIYMN